MTRRNLLAMFTALGAGAVATAAKQTGSKPDAAPLQLSDAGLETMVPKKLTRRYYEAFSTKDRLTHAHAINMLLVLSKFNQLNTSTI
jgi:hypothetical protein